MMFLPVHDMVEQARTIMIISRSNASYSGSVGANEDDKDWSGNVFSSHKFTVPFWAGLSILCVAICVGICWPDKYRKLTREQITTTRARSRSIYQSTSQLPRSRERSASVWSKVFSNRQDENSTSKRWPAIQRFASRSKSHAGDVEIQQVQPFSTGSPIQAGPTLHDGPRRRVTVEGYPSNTQHRMEGSRAEQERQRLREAWDRMEVWIEDTSRRPDGTRGTTPQLHANLPAIPEPVAQPDGRRTNNSFHPSIDSFRRADSPAMADSLSIRGIPPPTYAEHRDDEIAFLSDYQNPAHAAEDVGDAQGPPAYEMSSPVLPSWHPPLRPNMQ